jgi:Putative MetA-pathway of phenol degradation
MLGTVSSNHKNLHCRLCQMLRSIALATGFVTAGPAVHFAYGQESNTLTIGSSIFNCVGDRVCNSKCGCGKGKSDSQLGDGFGRNKSCERGTVGTLFRWSTNPANGKVVQLDEPLMSDRPDFTEASTVVGLGVLQVESGYTYTYDNNRTDRTIGHSYPETLFRYGIFANWLEFRLATNYSDEEVNNVRNSGADDLYLGFKIGLTAQEGWRPEMALMPQMTVPSGSSATTSGEVLPGLNWLYGWDLSERISTAGSTQFNRALDETTNASYTEWAQSWTVGYGLTEKLGGYTEYFGFYPAGADTARVQHYFDGGFTYSLTNDVQWDIRGGKGLNNAANDYFVGSGLVLRFH